MICVAMIQSLFSLSGARTMNVCVMLYIVGTGGLMLAPYLDSPSHTELLESHILVGHLCIAFVRVHRFSGDRMLRGDAKVLEPSSHIHDP